MVPMPSGFAGLDSGYLDSRSMVTCETKACASFGRLDLRDRGRVHPRGFRFADAGPHAALLEPGSPGREPGSPRCLSPKSPRSPRESPRSMRNAPAGKIVEFFRTGPPREASSPTHQARSSSPFPRESRSTSLVVAMPVASKVEGLSGPHIPLQEEVAARAASIRAELASLAASVAAVAEHEAVPWRGLFNARGRSSAGAPPALSPRGNHDSAWREGLSARSPERGGSRLFPCHLAIIRTSTSNSASTPSSAGASPAGSSPAQRRHRAEVTTKARVSPTRPLSPATAVRTGVAAAAATSRPAAQPAFMKAPKDRPSSKAEAHAAVAKGGGRKAVGNVASKPVVTDSRAAESRMVASSGTAAKIKSDTGGGSKLNLVARLNELRSRLDSAESGLHADIAQLVERQTVFRLTGSSSATHLIEKH